MSDFLTIGILGGMGPEATNRLCALITELTPACADGDHIPVITYNNPSIPNRVAAVRGEGASPVPELIRMARVLETAGADMILIPCNLAHLFVEDVQLAISIPIINMVEETARSTVNLYPSCRTVGLVASTPTIEFKIYEKAFAKHGRGVVSPGSEDQERVVMKAIYGSEGIKGGQKEAPRLLLQEASRLLVAQGAEVLIAGCTEASLVMTEAISTIPIVDPLEVVARVAISRATAGHEEVGVPAIA